MHRKLCRFWLNYRCPGKRSIPSVAPMLMVLQQGWCLCGCHTHSGDKLRDSRGHQSCSGREREDQPLAQSIIIFVGVERKNLPLKGSAAAGWGGGLG